MGGVSASCRAHGWAVVVPTLLGAPGCFVSRIFPGPPPAPEATPAAIEARADRAEPPDVPFAYARSEDAIVRVVGRGSACTGVLVADDQVLTAHHCLAERDALGDRVSADVDPSSLRVELGGDYLPWGEVGVRSLVAPPCGYRAGHGDIAILVLDRPLVGAPTLEVRLEDTPREGEVVDPVGFGRCASSREGIRRHQRQGGRIQLLRDDHFQLQAAVCPGDSGGPAVSADHGDVVGVLSASVMDRDENTLGRTEFTRLDAWRSVFAAAKLVSEGMNPSELPPLECTGRK